MQEAGAANGSCNLDAVIIGAGMAGLCALHQVRKLNMSVKVLEGGSDLGGTWFWNRYPGCRCDIDSVEYSYSFDNELQQEWSWSERYAAQPEILAYMNWVAKKLNLRSDMEFNTWIKSTHFDEGSETWAVTTDTGEVITCRYLIMATGCLSAPKKIDIKGTDNFAGETYYTYKWPHEGVDFTGKRVAIVGAGSSAIQAIPLIAKEASELKVFMRTANYSVPLQNCPTDKEYEADYKKRYSEVRKMQRQTFGGFVNVGGVPRMPRTDSALDATPEEREAEFEYRWESGGLCYYTSYADLAVNINANNHLSDFIRKKIRNKIDDPRLRDLLTPTEFPALTKRLCADTGYYETYNLDHVDIVNLKETPIEEITEMGILVGGEVMEFDCIVFATGFDAVTGALNNMDIRGRGGVALKDTWADGPSTYLGLMTTGFPNLFNVAGPGSTASLTHAIPCDEHQVELVIACIERVEAANAKSIEPIQAAEDLWTQHVNDVANMTLFPRAERANSWYLGANVPGKACKPLLYLGGFDQYVKKIDEVIDNDFEGFALSQMGN